MSVEFETPSSNESKVIVVYRARTNVFFAGMKLLILFNLVIYIISLKTNAFQNKVKRLGCYGGICAHKVAIREIHKLAVESTESDGDERLKTRITNSNLASSHHAMKNAEVIAIFMIYFVQGALGLSRLATSFFLKSDLGLDPAEAAAISGITMLPWIIKPIYGFLTDSIPIFGYRRRSYLIVSGLLGSLSWLAMGSIVHSAFGATIVTLLGSLSIAIADVVADSIVVEKVGNQKILNDTVDGGSGLVRGRKDGVSMTKSESTLNDLQSLCWGAASLGGVLTAYLSGSLLNVMTPQRVFEITAVFPLVVSTAAILIEEDKTKSIDSWGALFDKLKAQLSDIRATFSNPGIYLPVLFIFLWRSTPDPGTALFYFSTNELGFKPEFLGRVNLASSLASLLGVLGFRTVLKDVSAKDIIFWTTIVSVPLGLTQVLLATHYNRELGIPDELFALTDSAVLAALGQVAFMPTLVLAASLCPPGVEGTLFALLMSIYNASNSVSSELSAYLTSTLGVTDTNFERLPQLIALCSFSSLLALPFINLLDSDKKTPR